MFKKEIGITYSEYIISKRIAKAQFLLKNTTDTVINIAAISGFNNVTYFNRVFKKHLRLTPTEYRKLHKSQ